MSVTRAPQNVSYKVNYEPQSSYLRLSLKSFSDGRLVFGNDCYIWVVAMNGESQFKTTAIKRGGNPDFVLFNDNCVAYRIIFGLYFDVNIWNVERNTLKENASKGAVKQFVIRPEALNHYLIMDNVNHNLELKIWNGLDFQNVATLESEVKELSDLQVLPGGNIFYGRKKHDVGKIYSEYKFNGQIPELVWEKSINNSYFSNIFWISDQQCVGATNCGVEISLWGKNFTLLDGPYNLQSSIISVQPLKDSNYVFCCTYANLHLLQVVDNKLVFVNQFPVPRPDNHYYARDFTLLPNGDAAILSENDNGGIVATEAKNYFVSFCRFSELKQYRDNIAYKIVHFKYLLTVGLGLPPELIHQIVGYLLPEMRFYEASRKFGMFKPRLPEAAAIIIPGPGLQ